MKQPIKLFYFLIFLFITTGCSNHHALSTSVIEIVDYDYRFSTQTLLNFTKENNIDKSLIYQWQNHWVIYCSTRDAGDIKVKLENKYPKLTIRLYENPFYNFNRQKYSHEKPAALWDNIIMTSNMVADSNKQNEYLQYHRTQFEKWPEISKGFSNASFQQVLVFRHGRQLMLIISIPKGESLDKLNPKTTENNPRVVEWNSIMSNYQVGIDDAPKGVTWVRFDQLK